MLHNLEDTLNKTCLIALSYFDFHGNPLKASILAGKVVSVDNEIGIKIALLAKSDQASSEFILPANLAPWFKAPKGNFHTDINNLKIKDPQFLITWDIYQTKEVVQDNEQIWWEWVARTSAPFVN